ncbi:MAG: glycosyltransferase, partial [Proteobacteria bacterium]|nr:glycosyltransferase [Pseudomonadota bacterium]
MKVYIGYDSREKEAYNTCVNSIYKNSSSQVTIKPLKLAELKQHGLYTREVDPLSSTEFSFSRFLVPHLNDYQDWVVFCDCDFIFVEDIKNLFDLKDDKYAVLVCKHEYKPTTTVKMDGKMQSVYPRKNWSSLVLWNCKHPKNRLVTPELVNSQTGQYLHRFMWLDDSEIGELPIQWNWLVGWYKEPQDGKP